MYKKELIKEHKELTIKFAQLFKNLNTTEDKVEFANRSLQLNAMKNYAKALEARLLNVGVIIDGNGNYFSNCNVDSCSSPVGRCECGESCYDSDCDE